MVDVRCKGCNKVLAKVNVLVGAIKCPRCKMLFEYHTWTNLVVTNTYDPTETRGKIKEMEIKKK